MAEYFHALRVKPEQCRGHLTCMRRCPTQAIRIRHGKAAISDELCVDCGTCITVCGETAIEAICDPVDTSERHKYKVLIPSSVIYSQFDPSLHPHIIREACRRAGFDEVVDVSGASAILGRALIDFMKGYKGRRPLISSHCPAVIRLVQVRFPDLVEQIVPLDVPREVAAREIRETYPERLGVRPEDILIYYAAPCPAKIVSIKQPAEKERSWFDRAVSVSDLYSAIQPHISAAREEFERTSYPPDFAFHTGWAAMGGVSRAVGTENWLAVSGLDHVIRIFDDIENSRLRNIDFVEALACMLGCIGGPFNVESPYVARTNSIKQKARYETPVQIDEQDILKQLAMGRYSLENPVRPRTTRYFDTDLSTSIKRMKERERIHHRLPQKDCGCCGAPTCLAFAEDVVRREAELTDCIYLGRLANRNRPDMNSGN